VECLRAEVPFYKGWERGSDDGEGWLNGWSIGSGGEWRLSPLKLGLKGDNYCGVMEEGRGLASGERGTLCMATRGQQRPWMCCNGGRKKEKAVSEVYAFWNGRRQSGRAPPTRGRLGREGELGRARAQWPAGEAAGSDKF
jgi:hypothetical protein